MLNQTKANIFTKKDPNKLNNTTGQETCAPRSSLPKRARTSSVLRCIASSRRVILHKKLSRIFEITIFWERMEGKGKYMALSKIKYHIIASWRRFSILLESPCMLRAGQDNRKTYHSKLELQLTAWRNIASPINMHDSAREFVSDLEWIEQHKDRIFECQRLTEMSLF